VANTLDAVLNGAVGFIDWLNSLACIIDGHIFAHSPPLRVELLNPLLGP